MALYDQSKPGHSTGNPCSEEYETETLVGSGDDADCRTVQRRYAKFPPKVISCEKLGYIQDANGVGYSRDVGRSSVVNNRVFYQFGDTFCKNDHGDFVGIVSHTCARVVLPTHPLHTEYYKIEPSGLVQCFIPLTEREKEFDRQGTAQGTRTTLWSFGGIAEDGPGADKGWCWFEKGSAYKDGSLQRHGTGIARVYFDEDHGRLAARRPKEGPLFVNDEPSFGTFSTLLEDGWVYLWGTRAGEIFLARVRPLYALRRETYEYWNGYGYVADCGAAKPVLKDMQQGAIYRTKLFHWKLGYTHAFIGVNRFGDSKVMMGLATRLEGPYEMFPIADATGINERGGYMYCMYPHPWAFKEEDGELMVTWSEHWPGGVIGAKLKFDMGEAAD
ncbi:MAG: hypothetical protein M1817_003394 [Caeruleum heppii]|nr:MAG: hypothetical protein M1817_003394 [Caeruleum heppii]